MPKVLCQNPNCDVEFEAKRSTAKFHHDNCRVEAARLAGIADPETGETMVNPIPEPPKGYDREKNLEKFIKMGLVQTDWISTGLPDFDELTRIPLGRITQIQGPYGVGKTTLCLNMIRGLKDKKVLYIDSEASLNPELLVDLKLDPDLFHLYNESAYFEDISEVIREAAKSGEYDMVIFDSLASTTTKAEAEGDITASNIGQKAKLMHKLIHLTQMDFKNTNTAFVVINQEREVIGSYVPQKYTPGGNAVPYAASLIISLKTIKSWRFPKDSKNGLYLGHEVEATIIKSKVNQPWRTQKFKLYYPNPVAEKVEEGAF
jgi:RecA/RadA recombinase